LKDAAQAGADSDDAASNRPLDPENAMTTRDPLPADAASPVDEATNVHFLQAARHDVRSSAEAQHRPLTAWLNELLCGTDCCAIVYGGREHEPAVLLLGKHQLREAVAASLGQASALLDPAGAPAAGGRALLSLLFIDIVASTEIVERLGDAAWRALLAKHRAIVRAQLARHGGAEIDNAGDGFFATFGTPTAAVRCADDIRTESRAAGLELRAGIHTGECEAVGPHVSGVAVHVAARIAELAEPGGILVSATVRDLVAGSGLAFGDRGWHALKGLRESRQLFALAS